MFTLVTSGCCPIELLALGFVTGGGENELQVAVTEEMEEESLRIPAWKKRSRSKSLRGRRGVAQNPCVEKEESLRIPAWHLAYNRRRVRQVVALLDQDVLYAMSDRGPDLDDANELQEFDAAPSSSLSLSLIINSLSQSGSIQPNGPSQDHTSLLHSYFPFYCVCVCVSVVWHLDIDPTDLPLNLTETLKSNPTMT